MVTKWERSRVLFPLKKFRIAGALRWGCQQQIVLNASRVSGACSQEGFGQAVFWLALCSLLKSVLANCPLAVTFVYLQ
jgi:hypothetical protein